MCFQKNQTKLAKSFEIFQGRPRGLLYTSDHQLHLWWELYNFRLYIYGIFHWRFCSAKRFILKPWGDAFFTETEHGLAAAVTDT